MGAIRGRILYEIPVTGIRSSIMNIGIYGVFDTNKVHWSYYAISWVRNNQGNNSHLTSEMLISSYDQDFNIDNIVKYGRPKTDLDDGKKYCDEFKMKWESGLNNTTSEQRDKKLDEILK